MAEGRMLKRKISTDTKLADLENDSQRLLFTWAIPHLDIEGRMIGDPREFKAMVCPLLEKSTDEILSFFASAEHIGLIHRYEISGQWVLQFPGFKKNQSLNPNKEAKSRLPEPPLFNVTPGALLEHSGQIKINEVKLSKDKLIKTAAPSWNLSESEKKELAQLCLILLRKFPNRFNPYSWIQKNIGMNPQIHLVVLRQLANQNGIESPWPYADKISSEENKNMNAQDSEAECNQFKTTMPSIKDLLKGITK